MDGNSGHSEVHAGKCRPHSGKLPTEDRETLAARIGICIAPHHERFHASGYPGAEQDSARSTAAR